MQRKKTKTQNKVTIRNDCSVKVQKCSIFSPFQYMSKQNSGQWMDLVDFCLFLRFENKCDHWNTDVKRSSLNWASGFGSRFELGVYWFWRLLSYKLENPQAVESTTVMCWILRRNMHPVILFKVLYTLKAIWRVKNRGLKHFHLERHEKNAFHFCWDWLL